MGLWHWIFDPKLFYLNGWWPPSSFYEASCISKDFAVLRRSRCRHAGQCGLSRSTARGKTSLDVRKPAFCICESKDADQLRSNCAADQRLCFRFTDSTIPLLLNSEISSL